MHQKPLAIGIIGAGNMGRHHYGAVTNYGAQVVAVHDTRLEAARQLASQVTERFGNPTYSTTALENFFQVEMDGVVITTPPLSVLSLSRWRVPAVCL